MLKNLINLRKQAERTQKQMASFLGITERQYRRLEAGTSDGSVKIWQQLSRFFNTTIDYLLKQDVDNNLSSE